MLGIIALKSYLTISHEFEYAKIFFTLGIPWERLQGAKS